MQRILRPVKDFFGWHAKHLLNRVIIYALQKITREFTTLSADQVVSNGFEITVNDVTLNTKAVNAALHDFPFEVVEGFAAKFRTTLPWEDLGSSPLEIMAEGIDLTLRPRAPVNNASQLFEDMKGSIMTASLQCMKEVMEDEPKTTGGVMPEVSEMAAMLEKAKALIHISVEDITLRLEDVKDGNVIGLDIQVDRVEYFDERVRELNPRDGGRNDDESRSPLAWITKNIRANGIRISLDDDEGPCNPTIPADCTGSPMSELFLSALDEVADGDGVPRRHVEESDAPESVHRPTPVVIATMPGLMAVKLKTKEVDGVEGPKVDVDSQMSALHILLSPKQLKFVIRILSSFLSPTKSKSPSSVLGAVNRRMGPEDYRKVDLALHQNLMAGVPFEDMASDDVTLADGQPQFFTMEPVGCDDMSSSTTSLDTVGTKATSMFAGNMSSTEKKEKEKKPREERERSLEPGIERNTYSVTLATLSVCVLLEEPHDGSCEDWVTKMKALTGTYFDNIKFIPFVGQTYTLAQLRDRMSVILPRDHLGMLCKPVVVSVQDKTILGKTIQAGQSFTADVTVGCMEVVECLYDSRQGTSSSFTHNQSAPPSLPQYSEILVFPNCRTASEFLTSAVPAPAPAPAVRLSATINSKTDPSGYTFKDTELSLELGNAVVEVDITIQDRLNTLISTLSTPKAPIPQFGQSLLAGTGQCGFDEAMQDIGSSNAINMNISCPHATMRIRFPIPDLRPGNQHAPREWWGRNLRKESLLLEVDHLSVLRDDKPDASPSQPSITQAMCNKLEVYFQEDFNKTPVLFGSVQQGPGDVGDNFNRPRVVVKSFPSTSTLLEQKTDAVLESTSCGFGSILQEDLLTPRPGATPFSVKKEVTHGTHLDGDDQEGFEATFEKVIPGNKEECRKFVDMSSSNTSLLVEITGPKVLAMLHDKPFVELLYNRINNDLLLWEPQSPSPPDNFASGLSLNVQPLMGLWGHMTQSMYQARFDSDNDSDDEGGETAPTNTSPSTSSQPSDMCISINIGEGRVFANIPIIDEEGEVDETCHGELMLLIKEGLLFVSVGHEGNHDLRYLTFTANNARFLHAGRVSGQHGQVKMEHLDTMTPDQNKRFVHMADRIYRSEHSVPITPLTSVGTGEMSEDMVSVAVKIEVDSLNNNKHFCVSAAVKGGTLRFEKFNQGENWIGQVIDLLDLKDYPIEGYVMPEVITDLHIELQGCAVDYRPKNFPIPLRALLTAQKFNLAVNLNTGAHYTSLRFILDEAKLWLSNKDFMEIRLDSDYITMAYNSLLEIGLRLGQAKEGGSHTLLWFSSSRTELAMCADSCAALTLLIQHFMRDGDLKTAEERAAEEQRDVEMRNSLYGAAEDERMMAKQKHVEKMVAEALLEAPKPPQASPSRKGQTGTREMYFMPDGKEKPPVRLHPRQAQHQASPTFLRPDLTTLQDIPGHEKFVTDYFEEEEECFQSEEDDEEEFTFINDPGLGIGPRKGEPPVVRWFNGGPQNLTIKSDYLTKLNSSATFNDLKTPADYPTPQFKTVIREWNLDVTFYGGNDFDLPHCKNVEKPKEETYFRPQAESTPQPPPVPCTSMWKGGVHRRHDFMTKLSLTKLRLNYETYAEKEERSRRLVLVVKTLEIQDNVRSSKYNKLLYWHNASLSPEGVNMALLKILWERPFSDYNTEECSIMLTLQPLKVNVNQDTLFFMQNYFGNVSRCSNILTMATSSQPGSSPSPSPSPSRVSSDSSTPREKSASREPAPILSVEGGEEEEEEGGAFGGEDNLIHLDDSCPRPRTPSRPEHPKRQDVEHKDAPMFIKSFRLTRPVPLSIDYCGTAANINSKDGLKTLAVTVASGLLTLENAQIWLKQLELNKGYVGLGKLVEAIFKEWGEDIEGTQKIRLIGGVPILGALKLLGDGLYQFVTQPYLQWQRDGRIWRGLQKGASSLGSAAQLALIDLLQVIFDTLQVISECSYDFLSSGKSVRSYRKQIGPPPKDMRDGVAEAYTIICEGMKGTVANLVTTASKQREQKGLAGAMGTATKEGTAVVIGTTHLAATAIRRVCTSYKYNLHPESQQEDKEKWKSHN